MIFSAKMSGNLGVRYAVEALSGKVAVDVNDSFSSQFFIDPNASTSVAPFHQVNAALSWTSRDDKWNARLWGTNITYAKPGFRSFAYIPGEPPKYGVEIGFKF
jgi:hypothetical protein